jgi:DNA polymerase-1
MENNKEKLFLLDAFALIYRSFFAFAKNPRISSKGENTSAVFGFMNTLLDVIEKENPKYVAVAFDTSEPTFRHVQYEEYKANREAMPEGIQVAIPRIFSLLEAMNITVIKQSGFEADDLIGSLAWQMANDNLDVYMMTPDKDYAQLIKPNVFMYKPARMGKGVEIWGEEQVKEKFEVEECIRVIDFLGMMGDASDNIPGIPGVGEKTAKKFLKAYGSMEGLYENLDQLKGKQKEKVEANKELAFLSKELATIKTDIDTGHKIEDFKRKEYNHKLLSDLFKELEFYSSAKRLQISLKDTQDNQFKKSDAQQRSQTLDLFSQFESVEETSKPEAPKENTNVGEYKIVESEDDLVYMIEKLFTYKSFAFRLDTTSLNPINAEISGIAFSGNSGESFYLPFPSELEEQKKRIQRIRPLLAYNWITRVSNSLKYDIQVLKKYNIELGDKLFDIELAHYLLEPDMKHDLDRLSELYLNTSVLTLEDLVGKKSFKEVNKRDLDQNRLRKNSMKEADVLSQLFHIFSNKIEDQGLKTLFETMEMPLVPVLANMELVGVHLDTENLRHQSTELSNKSTILEKEIYELAGKEFNIASPKQLGFVLFDDLQLDPKAKKTKSGQYSTAEPVLDKLKKKHPIIEKILDFRGIQKLLSTYVDSLPKLIHPTTGNIHTNYRQTVAATGRLSSTNPNLQNIPIRTVDGRKVREAFVPRSENRVLLAADYSQIELRLIAHMSQDPEMIKAFNEGSDFHAATASRLFNVPAEEVTRELRSYAKTVNFGIIYGVSAFGLSQQTDLSRSESKMLIENYYQTYPRLKEYIDEMVATAREKGFVETIFNRRRILRDIHSRNAVMRTHAERNAVNAPVQGSAADLVKMAMIKVFKEIKNRKLDVDMILQVHDELVFDCAKDCKEEVKELVKDIMEEIVKLDIPLIVDINEGENWLQAH